LTPAKEVVAHGDRGYSRKGRSPERASCYYSFSRLQAAGNLVVGNRVFTVAGSAWMDHEFSSAPLEDTAVGWDWFSLQLSDQTELMLFQIREENGGISPASGGTYIDKTGRTRRLGQEEVTLKVRATWRSPHSGAVYPSQWEIRVPVLDLVVGVTSNLAGQELNTSETTNVTYWEGSVSLSGRKATQDVGGHGYAELTGYAEPFRSPL
jgi:predicted secreted hydrolase